MERTARSRSFQNLRCGPPPLTFSLAGIARMESKRSVDWMCIGIEKLAEAADSAQYAFLADVREPDPEYRSRTKVVGQNRGILRILKTTGEVTLVEPMPEDDADARFARAAAKIRKHWESGELPDKTMFASG